MKKRALLLALGMILGIFAGCAHRNHEWTEATCTEPKTCTVGGETEGEPLGHDWAPASCTEPRTCRRCGVIEGEPLGHDWAPATCTQPGTCRRCGERSGEPLGHSPAAADYWHDGVCAVCGEVLEPRREADFVTYGLERPYMELGQTYDYVTLCHENHDAKTIGHVTPVSYEITPGDGDMLPVTEGYEWRTAAFRAVFDDENAWNWGMEISTCFENYYDIRQWDDTAAEADETVTHTVLWDGRDVPVELRRERELKKKKNGQQTYEMTVWAHVPVGYDGVVIGYRDASAAWGEGMYIFDVADENTLFFRLA